jgi:hypothetical protein
MQRKVDLSFKDLDIEKLYYSTLSLYQNLINDEETIGDLEDELPEYTDIKDVKIEYNETSIHIKKEENQLFVNFDLYLNEKKIGYYKNQYSFEGEFIDEFLVFF